MIGFEPMQSAWKAEILPLNYIRKSQFITDDSLKSLAL